MGEMMDDAFESLDEDGVEEEAAEEVDKVLYEITKGLLHGLPACIRVMTIVVIRATRRSAVGGPAFARGYILIIVSHITSRLLCRRERPKPKMPKPTSWQLALRQSSLDVRLFFDGALQDTTNSHQRTERYY